jgi:hypothetical protein
MITGKLYDWLKYIAQIALPALGTLYFTLAGIWGLESGEEVVGSIMAVDLCLGVLLGISQSVYNKQVGGGVMKVTQHDGAKTFTLELDGDPADLPDKKEVRFRVADGGE